MSGHQLALTMWNQKFPGRSEVSWDKFWEAFGDDFVDVGVVREKHKLICKLEVSDAFELSELVTKREWLAAMEPYQDLQAFWDTVKLRRWSTGDSAGGRGQRGEGSRWSAKVEAPVGTHIVQWEVRTKLVPGRCRDDAFTLNTVVGIRGRDSKGRWLELVQTSPSVGYQTQQTEAQTEGYTRVFGHSGGWLTKFMGVGDSSRDDPWELRGEDLGLSGNSRVIGYAIRYSDRIGIVECVRILFGCEDSGRAELPRLQDVRRAERREASSHREGLRQHRAGGEHAAARQSTTRWKYDVFISHAGEDKDFAFLLRDAFSRIGLLAFVDQASLVPGAKADVKMLDAAGEAPVGIALLSESFFSKQWPVRELKIIAGRGSVLLPVLYNIVYERARDALLTSPHADGSPKEWEGFVESVMRTTAAVNYSSSKDRLYFIESVVFSSVRKCVEVAQTLVDSDTTNKLWVYKFAQKVKGAAETVATHFEKIYAYEVREAKTWAGQMEALLERLDE